MPISYIIIDDAAALEEIFLLESSPKSKSSAKGAMELEAISW
jgi:hypothetical protein